MRSLTVGASIVIAFVVYAYGFQVTQVDLEEAQSPRRQEQLVRILRALAHPDILTFPQAELVVEAPFYMPCPSIPLQMQEANPRGPYILLSPACTESGGRIRVDGFNFDAGTTASISLIPPSGVSLRLGQATADAAGDFSEMVQLPERSSDELQTIRAVVRQNTGTPRLSRTAIDTWDKIVETVFLAFLATTFGVLIAVPLSFMAARNLMKGVTGTIGGISLTFLSIIPGVWIGSTLARYAVAASEAVQTAPLLSLGLVGVSFAGAGIGARWALPPVELARPPLWKRLARAGALTLAALVGLFGLIFLSRFLEQTGDALAGVLGVVAFLGIFIGDLGEILSLLIVVIAVAATAGSLGSAAGRLGEAMHSRLKPAVARILDLILGAAAGAAVGLGFMAVIDWLYELGDPLIVYVAPAAIGASLGLILGVRYGRRDTIPVGLLIYNLSRTLLNVFRAIEPLIMVIVAVVWVGIGPFAGVIALSIHTVAALAKLYSEQVESILPGPLEAIAATGATRIQTIIYAVVPQVVPPYISFTMYRWDINVRFSTVIGFAGGGGIGFLLIQNINLLNYRAAAAQMLAIAIVVTILDYLSSYLREKFV
ncbi:MAG TPA: ABC transporter permease subunit [Anaerolineales bacterium]|nr:ABC transporter permease subunit [Anaerolineales bacterium]